MATFKVEIKSGDQRRDGKYPISIRLTHKRVPLSITTGLYATPKQLNKDFTIKDAFLYRSADKIVQKYEKLVQELGINLNLYSTKELKEYLLRNTGTREGESRIVDFFAFAKTYIDEIRNEHEGTADNHESAIANLKRYVGSDKLDINSITYPFLQEYLSWMKRDGGMKTKAELRTKKDTLKPLGVRGQSLYLGSIKKIHKEARKKYNKHEKNEILIPLQPFEFFEIPEVKPQVTVEEKALPIEMIRAIRDYTPKMTRDELARDCFMISFYSCGMNSVDIYSCTDILSGSIRYFRSKTTGRKKNRAEMRVRIEPELKALLNKYKGTDNVYSFSERYSTPDNFNKAINKGLKHIAKTIGLDDLKYYWARHSWASIARNDCDVPKDVVSICLTHSDDTPTTDLYIKRDWSKVYNANRKVLDYLGEDNKKKKES